MADSDEHLSEPERDNDCGPSAENALNALADIKHMNANDSLDTNLSNQLETVQKYLEQMDLKCSTQEHVKAMSNEDVQKMAANKKTERKLNVVIAEYEKTIAQMVRKNAVVIKERDTLQKHLSNAEAAFSDVHEKYERCKGIIEKYKNNESVLRESIRKSDEEIIRLNSKYEALKTHAMGQLEKANNELLEYRRSYDDEVIRLKATKQKLELQVSSLKITVDQRTKECEELTRICDDLITKVGR